MDFSFTEEQEAVRDLSRQIFADNCEHERLTALERDQDGDGIDHELWRALADAHLLGTAISEKYGGSELGLGALFILLEEAGRALAPLPLMPSLVQGALAIEKFGSDSLRNRWLPGLASGEILLTAGLEEIGVSDLMRPATVARPGDKRWILSGRKVCVPAAQQAARILIAASTGDGTTGVFLVDPRAEGVRLEVGIANNYERQYEVSLENVAIDSEDVLGDPLAGQEILEWLLDVSQTALAAMQLGICDAALRKTAEYTSERKQFGRAIGTFQAVTMRLADSFIDLECMKSTVWQAAWRLEEGLPSRAESTSAKWWACQGGSRVAHSAMHLHGGTGADIDYPIHRYFIWSQQIGLTLGGAGEQLARLGALHAAS
jgi:alkylation response protein AidB-like acyl-CoA dehydrogenase